MSTYDILAVEDTKPCAGKGCMDLGTNLLEVLYINKVGWFCDRCKGVLLRENLAIEGEK
jgi:hypothetical protein